MKSPPELMKALRANEIQLPPASIRFAGVAPQFSTDDAVARPDAYLNVVCKDRVYRFVASCKVQPTPKAFREAVELIHSHAHASEMHPMLVVTYLSPERLDELESRGVSGIDLSGNGVVVVPGELLVYRTGRPNQYPSGRKIRDVYRGTSSLVARSFLARPSYDTVQEILDEIIERGGRMSLSTVSKVLKVLEEDLVVRRMGRASDLLQPEELLDRLARSYRPPNTNARKRFRWLDRENDLKEELGKLNERLVLTGAASVDRYAVMPREKTVQCYCETTENIEQHFVGRIEESPRFPDLELIETQDPTVYFDKRQGEGVSISSPIQSWLELQVGDKRQSDASKTVHAHILQELQSAGWKPR